ncbi:3-hydroxyacyl-ACP dehydratase FabZ [Lacticaseibacillus pantheris]|uniref:3-hydroxyacyl-ACP dehydratase FabZ n=2 Tax=Lacticaseibacillus TaxID=2759736 RepID=UPI002596A1D8|nr:3-hydroxyacyl-ACP dehydratase FabZ [Lacticaseibacillus pantheris]WKF84908.1 3-hydroxyacyl-ACP dehydratase FabZ [Lacticaseibacillus pantheris]
MAVMDAQTIMQLIPNRYPILFMDYVDELNPGESIIATKNVTINEQFFQGHFPGNPVMPGVLIIESLAQAASILILKSPEFAGQTAYLGAISSAKFHQIVRPGDVLKLHVEFTKRRNNMGVVHTYAMVGDNVAAKAELTFIVSPNTEGAAATPS